VHNPVKISSPHVNQLVVQQHHPAHAELRGDHANRETYIKLKPLDTHNDEKQALILGLTGLTLFVIWWVK